MTFDRIEDRPRPVRLVVCTMRFSLSQKYLLKLLIALVVAVVATGCTALEPKSAPACTPKICLTYNRPEGGGGFRLALPVSP